MTEMKGALVQNQRKAKCRDKASTKHSGPSTPDVSERRRWCVHSDTTRRKKHRNPQTCPSAGCFVLEAKLEQRSRAFIGASPPLSSWRKRNDSG